MRVNLVLTVAAPAAVSFGFFNSYGTGYHHTITIGATTYTYIQIGGDGSGTIATALAALVNAGTGDPNAIATVNSNNVVLAPRCTAGVACSASDGNGAATLSPLTPVQIAAVGGTLATRVDVQMAAGGTGLGYYCDMANFAAGTIPSWATGGQLTAALKAASAGGPGGSFTDAPAGLGCGAARDVSRCWVDGSHSGDPVIVSYDQVG